MAEVAADAPPAGGAGAGARAVVFAAFFGAGGGVLLAGPTTGFVFSSLAVHSLCRADRAGTVARRAATNGSVLALQGAEALSRRAQHVRPWDSTAVSRQAMAIRSSSKAMAIQSRCLAEEDVELESPEAAPLEAAKDEELATAIALQPEAAVQITLGREEALRAQAAASAGGAPAARAAEAAQLRGVRVRQLMANFELGISLDLAQLALQAPNAERRGSTLHVRSFNPRYGAILHQSGRVSMHSSGLAEEEARMAAKKLARMVRKCHCAAVTFKRYTVRNVQLAANLPFRLQPESACKVLGALPGFQVLKVTRNAVEVEVKDLGSVLLQSCGLLLTQRSKSIALSLAAMKAVAPSLQECVHAPLQTPSPRKVFADGHKKELRPGKPVDVAIRALQSIRTELIPMLQYLLRRRGPERKCKLTRCLKYIRHKRLLATCRMGQLVFRARRFLSLGRFGTWD
ncbi:unnamed protein product [Effrenium voratum]|nr:unnamed protein product [Effrenium voratum]